MIPPVDLRRQYASINQFLEGVMIEVAGETTTTDQLGNFKLVLPEEKMKDEYTIYATKEGFQLKEEPYYPKLGQPADIRLKPIK